MRRIADFTSKKQHVEIDLSIASTTLEELSNKAQEILRREILNLMGESTGGKLNKDSARALIDYIKLLNDLRKEEEKTLRGLADDHLKKLVEE